MHAELPNFKHVDLYYAHSVYMYMPSVTQLIAVRTWSSKSLYTQLQSLFLVYTMSHSYTPEVRTPLALVISYMQESSFQVDKI